MKSKLSKVFSLCGVFFLTACGYSLKETYRGDEYNSVDFMKNYYQVWNNDINYHSENCKVSNINEETIELNKSTNKVFTSYDDDNFLYLDSIRHESCIYEYDRDSYKPEEITEANYGPSVCLAKDEETFRYGYVSKLFDGQFFCNGDFEHARVQIDENGFGCLFNKEYSLNGDNKYFGVNLKGSIEFRRTDQEIPPIPSHISKVELIINFFLKNDLGYTRLPVSYELDVPTNTGDANRKHDYLFFGFELNNGINIDRCAGISFEYRLISDSVLDNLNEKEEFKNRPLHHSLLLYEIVMPDSIWH